ncbi:hypothetical protein [Shinella sp.]|uniref:hypothetical protein n=1 Tax=Shinella sp. TaxID=1870904 RepID=UPI00289790A2|nr:hypothetical protein [Shinella sp.]
MSAILIAKIVAPEGEPRPYRLIETYATSEGMRTRVCSGCWATMGEAEFQRSELESVIKGGRR